MDTRDYDCLLLDLDGTLVGESDELEPGLRLRLRALRAAGVRVVIATGRSDAGVDEIVRQLEVDEPVVVYNGAAVWDPTSERLIEERLLSDRTVARTLRFARERDFFPVVQRRDGKSCSEPRSEALRRGLRGFQELVVQQEELPREHLIRITLFSERHADSASFAAELEAAIDQPMYVTHFPLSCLALHRDSPLQVLDVQPPCRGKGEALRVVEEHFAIPAARVVAIGDATNDLPMLRAAGLGVAVRDSMPEARAAADRVLEQGGPAALVELFDELFPNVR